MAKQLVLSGNRVIAHGEDCFLSMGGTVICPESGRVYQNATVANVDSYPSDIGEVGYEYHAGQFVPCAPYGKGGGNLAVLCPNDCKSIKDSGIDSEKTRNVSENGLTLSYLPNIEMPSRGYTDIAYGNGVFVATKGTTAGAYSKDGEIWETISFPASATKVVFGNGVFVVVGAKDAAAYSTDGITWTATSIPYTSNVEVIEVAYGGGMFVAINNGRTAFYSTDGITWTSSTFSSNTNYANREIAYGNGNFVITRDGGECYYSTDGITWKQGVATNGFSALTYAEGMFVGIARDTYKGRVYYTTDPTTAWTEGARLTDDDTWTDIDYGNGVFVAVSNGAYAAYSTDGINWTETTLPEDNNLAAIAHNEDRFIAVGGAKALDSMDGKEWPFRGSYRLRLPNGADVTDTVKTALGI